MATTDARQETRARLRLPPMTVLGPILTLVILVLDGAAPNFSFLNTGDLTSVLSRSASLHRRYCRRHDLRHNRGRARPSVGAMAAFIARLMILVMNAALPALGAGLPIVLLGWPWRCWRRGP